MAAFLLVPIIAAIGFAVDTARIWLVQSRLQTAADAAALVAGRGGAGRGINTSTAIADATAIYWLNFGRYNRKINAGYLNSVASAPTVQTLNNDMVKVSAAATVDPILMGAVNSILGQPVTPTTVSATASTQRALHGMELAPVLDITGSMVSNDNIDGLRTAATNLTDIVFGPSDSQPNLFASVAPLTARVNIGKSNTAWLKAGTLNQAQYSTALWAGCVEARSPAAGEDSTDIPPGAAPFTPTFWPSILGKHSYNGKAVKGDNDWSATNLTEANQANLPDNTAAGPNLACPAVAIQPLTTSKATVMAAITALKATFRGGAQRL